MQRLLTSYFSPTKEQTTSLLGCGYHVHISHQIANLSMIINQRNSSLSWRSASLKLTGWPVELSKQWEEMVVSKGWQVGGQHNHGYEDERQENHGGGKMGGKAAKGSLWEWGARKDWVGERTTEKKGQHIHRFLFFIKYGHKTNKIFEIRNSSTNRNIFTFS